MTRFHGSYRRVRWIIAASVVLAACVAGDRPTVLEPDYEISDGAHSGGTPGFFFLAPMVWDDVEPTGEFDASLLPQVVVTVCELAQSGCGPEVARFTADGPLFKRVTTSQFTIHGHVFEQYLALWRTDAAGIRVDKIYRVTVFSAGQALGFADVKLVRTKQQAESVDRSQFTLWVKGLPLPIRFRIETGVVVSPGDAASLELTGLQASLVAGVQAPVTITARDANGNVASGYRGTVALTSSDPEATLPADYTFTDADAGVHTFADAVAFATAGTVTLRAADAANAGIFGEATVTVEPAPAALLEVTELADPIEAGAAGSIRVTARDASGNVATDYVGTIAFTSGDPQATLPAAYTFVADDAGTHVFSAGVTLRTAGNVTVTATDETVATITGAQTVAVTPAAAAELVLNGVPDPATAGVAFSVMVTLRDQFANIATAYVGTVQFSSSDPSAVLPAAYQFQAADAGVREFPGVMFKTAGLQTLHAGDAAAPAITASATVTVEAAAAAELRYTTPPVGAPAGTPIVPPVVVTAFDEFGNTAPTFAGLVTVEIGTNAASGVLSGTLQRTAALGIATFDDLSINAAGMGYTLVSSAAGLTGTTSDPFDIAAVQPTEAHWINPAGGLWSVASNWSTGALPALDQAALIDLAGTYTVTLDVNATVRSLSVGGPSGVQTVSAGSNRVLGIATTGTILSSGRLTLFSATLNGPGTLTNAAGGVLTLLSSSTVNAILVNAGTLLVQNGSVLNGAFSTVTGSLVRVQSIGFGGATLTVASGGFTNHGVVELTSTSANGVALNVNGTLTNAADGTITILPGAGGDRGIRAQLDNQGTLIVNSALGLNRGSADHVNSGTMALNADLSIPNQGGTSPSFTNAGTVTVAPGRTWFISNSSFTQAAGATLDGGGAMSLNAVNPAVFGSAFGLGALSLQGTTANFTTDITTATVALSVSNSTLNGPITLTNAATKTLTIAGTSVINTPVVNAGTLVVVNVTTLNNSFTTVPGSLLRVQSIGFGGAALTVATAAGFTNHGVIELTGTATNGVSLNANGTLVNAPDGTIAVLFGVGGARALGAQLDNQGTMTLSTALAINRASADHSNSGTVNVSGGDLALTQSGTTPTFTNSGTVTLGAGRTWVNAGTGSFNNAAGGQMLGAGTFQTNSGTALANSGSITAALVRIGGALTSDAPGGFAPTTMELIGTTSVIPVSPGFSYTNIRLNTTAPSVTFAASHELPGFLAVAGTSNLAIGALQISVAGEFRTETSGVLTMQNADGALTVGGRAVFGGGSTNGRLTAGVLRVAGDFVQQGNTAAFAASGSHVTALNGTGGGPQTVSFANPGTTTTTSHFQRLEIANASAAGIVLTSGVFANGQLRTPSGADVARVISSANLTLSAGGLDAFGLVLDGTALQVVNGDALARFDNATFRNMNATVSQFRLDRLADVVTFNNTTFETAPSTGVYLHLVDTDLGGTLFTVTMQNTTPANHGGRVIESVAGQLLGWPL